MKLEKMHYTTVTQNMLCLIFLMCAATMHRLKCNGQEQKIQFAPYEFDIPLILK